jgi:hypothetical protein
MAWDRILRRELIETAVTHRGLALLSAAARVAATAVAAAALVATSATASPVQTGKARGFVPHHKSAFPPASFQLSPDSSLQYFGGPVLRTNETFAIFWDPAGRLSASYRDLVIRYLKDIAADSGEQTNVYSVLDQYFDRSGPIAYDTRFAGSIVDTDPFPRGCPVSALFPDCFTDQQLANELDGFLFAHGIERPPTRAFLVLTPEGVNSRIDAAGRVCASTFFCAYHSDFSGAHGSAIYANLPYAALPGCDVGEHPNGSDADPVLNALSHEHREMINDPLASQGNRFAPGPPFAWFDPFSAPEGSDKCESLFGPTRDNGTGRLNQVINGHPYLLQMEWSNALAAAQGFGCVLDGADHAPETAFTATVRGATVDLDAGVTTDPDPGDSIQAHLWRFGDGLGGFAGESVHHHYASAGTYRVQLQTVDSHGATSLAERDVTVSQPKPAPMHAFKAHLVDALDIRGFGSGAGNATGLGSVTESADLFWDLRDAPEVFRVLGFDELATRSDDRIVVSMQLALRDVSNPPQGTDYAVTGSYVVEGGMGAMVNATGRGAITGTCTSSFTSDAADCDLRWEGEIGSQ